MPTGPCREEEEEDGGGALEAAAAAAEVGRRSMLSRGFHTGEPANYTVTEKGMDFIQKCNAAIQQQNNQS